MKIFQSSSYRLQAAIAACLLLSSVAMPTCPARADDTSSRIRKLEGSVDTLNRAVFKGEAAPVNLTPSTSTDYQSSVETRLSGLETQLREIIGKVEQQEFENTQMKTKLDKALADIELRFQDANSGVAPARQSGTLSPSDMGGTIENPIPENTPTPPTTEPAPLLTDPNAPASQESPTVKPFGSMTTSPDGTSIQPKAGDDPAGQYEMAFSLLKSGNFASAKNGFEAFIETYPNHPLISNATYWLGESFYANGEYEKATRIFAESYKKYPKGPKVADSLLKMGMSLGAAGKKKEACVALKQLKKEFPSGDTVTLKRADQEITRLACAG